MRLPTQLSRQNPNAYKNNFGHSLIIAGSKKMLGAGALASLAAMRSGAGLCTWAVPKSLNEAAQKKASNVVMTNPLSETKEGTLNQKAYKEVSKQFKNFQSIAIGPGLSTNMQTLKFSQKIIEQAMIPLVIDADALTAVSQKVEILTLTKTPKILTPHPGEMAKLAKISAKEVESQRKQIAKEFALRNSCILVLKGNNTIVTDGEKSYTNRSGNAGMATAGSGDVLTGIIAGLLAQGLKPYIAAKFGAYIHGKAGDLAAKNQSKLSLIATDILEYLPQAFKLAK